jgi:2-polyprenyl-3-methyl-5-hydroxy-6-metoxy-1,4-benzoquinol methylase
MVKNVKNYGWTSSKASSCNDFISPKIIQICSELGVHRIIDIGCGNGVISGRLANSGFDVTGCDADEKGIEIAKQSVAGVNFQVIGVYDDPVLLRNSDFDAVVSTEVIEHLFLPGYLPKFAKAVLKDSGYLIISTPYHGYLKNLAISLVNKWDVHHQSLNDGAHIKFFSRKTLTYLLEQEGFKVCSFYGVGNIGLGHLPYLWNSMILVAQKS